jgi:hypothetical protein
MNRKLHLLLMLALVLAVLTPAAAAQRGARAATAAPRLVVFEGFYSLE